MKITLSFLLISIMIGNCSAQDSTDESVDTSLLEFYRQYSSFTDPGEYDYLYKNLPDSLPELCSLIKSQFIHPYAELPKYRELIPKERWNESFNYPTVNSVLEGLLSHDSSGLVSDRLPEDRLVLGCRHNAILLASLLKYRGIPARVRCGHATYIMPGFHMSHTICEVWNENDKRWMLVDPSMDMIDFSSEKFDISNDIWLKMQNGEIDLKQYGIPRRYSGLVSIVGKVCTDLASILGNEFPVNQYAPILEYAIDDNKQIPAELTETLDRISELMKSLDADNLSKLQEIYNNTPQIQITRSFEAVHSDTENKTSNTDASESKPIIDFTDIPAGTFTMGSPDNELGRENDEIQHEVTLRAFKMSKYTITSEQYNMFCEATGRIKPGAFSGGNHPVSQVTWNDAAAFAKWMDCRLPTEAEWEYAARANTTTPFYTGDCLTSLHANFNGKEPYANCVERENINIVLPVGSYPPNTFGLYDMHGNIWQWCSDWYGEYYIDGKTDPTGPEMGTQKIIRGGGWRNSARECRSSYRGGGGLYPGTRGAGIGFRVVKDEKN